jgi:neurofibromin 1
MKVLSFAMAARWTSHKEEVIASSRSTKGSTGSSAPSWIDPVPLDDNCARYILSVMVLYLRQTAPPETRLMSSAILSLDSSFYDFESVDVPTYVPALDYYCHEETTSSTPHSAEATLHSKSSTNTVNSDASNISVPIPMMPLSFNFDKTHMSLVRSSLSLNNHIGKYAGRIIYHLSASNWLVVFQRIRSRVHLLSSTSEDRPDTVDLQIMSYSAMDRSRLVQVLQGMFFGSKHFCCC